MGRISIAFRAFFRALTDAAVAEQMEAVLAGRSLPEKTEPVAKPSPTPVPATTPPAPKLPVQNPAVTLLAALQREARLIDFLQEDLAGYADEQIGSAVRDVHRDSRKVLDRLFGLRPIVAGDEGSSVEIASLSDPGKFRLTGKGAGGSPQRGTLQHHGWEAARCELPQYTGSATGAMVIAPAEIEAE